MSEIKILNFKFLIYRYRLNFAVKFFDKQENNPARTHLHAQKNHMQERSSRNTNARPNASPSSAEAAQPRTIAPTIKAKAKARLRYALRCRRRIERVRRRLCVRVSMCVIIRFFFVGFFCDCAWIPIRISPIADIHTYSDN